MKLPPLTTKQQDILKLLYSYRFLNRIQIQKLMGHKNRKNINVWLSDLRDKHYVEWIYSTDFAEKTKPAIYYLGINGVRYLRSTNEYPLEQVRKRYRERVRKRPFIERSVLIADCCITLKDRTDEQRRFMAILPADFINPSNTYHFLSQSDVIKPPHLCYIKHQDTPAGPRTVNYLLEIFDTTLPHYQLKYRLLTYKKYVDYNEWHNSLKDKASPTILLVCPTPAEMIYCKRRMRMLLKDVENRKKFNIKFTTTEKLQQHGVLAGIWEKA